MDDGRGRCGFWTRGRGSCRDVYPDKAISVYVNLGRKASDCIGPGDLHPRSSWVYLYRQGDRGACMVPSVGARKSIKYYDAQGHQEPLALGQDLPSIYEQAIAGC